MSILFTHQAYGLRFPLSELSVTGIRTAGVAGINLKDEDQVVAMEIVSDDEGASILIATQRGTVKRMGLKELDSAKSTARCCHAEGIKNESISGHRSKNG